MTQNDELKKSIVRKLLNVQERRVVIVPFRI